MAPLQAAATIRADARAARLHRPEAGLVSAAAPRRGIGVPARCARASRVRYLALGRFLVSGAARRDVQAARLRAGAAPSRADRRGQLQRLAARADLGSGARARRLIQRFMSRSAAAAVEEPP